MLIIVFWMFVLGDQAVCTIHGCLIILICIKKITEEELLPSKPLRVNGVDVPLFLIGDSAYPLNTWLIKPFPHTGVLYRTKKHLIIGFVEHVLWWKMHMDV